MEKKLLGRLIESMQQMNEIINDERAPSREFNIDTAQIKAIRKSTGLSQSQFCDLIDVQVATLRNWEQGRREPTGPAKALLRVIKSNPQYVLRTLSKHAKAA